MDINKNSTDAIKLNNTNLETDNKPNVSKVNRYTANKKISNNNKDVKHLKTEDAVVCTANNQQQKQLIKFYEKKHDPKSVVILDANNDLENNDLLKTIHCDKNGKITISEGRLFTDEKLQIIINISEMSAGEIARLNDLLSSPPTCLGKPLGKNVQRLVIIDEKMLHNNSHGPAADCWRRLARLKFYEGPKYLGIHSLQSTSANNNPEKSLQATIPKLTASTQQQVVTADFSTTNNWRTLLFGDIALNEKGKIYFHDGYLANLEDNQIIVLQDAPWDDQEFVSTLETAIRQGGFRANGNWINLPDDFKIAQKKTDKEQLNKLKNKLVISADELEQSTIKSTNYVCINTKNLESILANTQLNDGLICSCDTLSELIAGSEYILITSPLSNKQWLQLLNRIDKLPTTKPSIVDCSKNMLKQLPQHDAINVKSYEHQASAIADYQQQGYAIYQITADTNTLELWQNIALSSQNEFLFDQQNTQLLTDLQQGNPVVFYGMESNLQVISQLETLLATPPYLFINGKKVVLPHANITILWSYSQKTNKNNALFNHYLQQAEIIKKPYKSYFDYSFADRLLEIITDLNSPLHNKYIPFSEQNFNDIFAKQLQIECDLDRSTTALPVHYRKAAHNLIAKYYRDQPEIYGYLKTKINILKPDTYKAMVDASTLKQWLQQHPNADRNLLTKNFWSLVRYCSLACTDGTNKLRHLSFDIKANDEVIDRLADVLLDLVEDDRKDDFKQRFNLDENYLISEKKKINYIYYNGHLRSQLYDALLIAADKIDLQQPLSETAKSLAVRIEHAIGQHPQKIAIMEVFNLLAEVFPEDLLSTEFKDLPELLVTGKTSTKRKQQRRIKRFVAKLQQHPLIFLQGVAGTGKSHIAKIVATELSKQSRADMPDPLIISLSPETTSQDLYGAQRLKSKSANDNYTEFVNGPLLNWATSDNPPLLILDEANLVKEGVLAPLAGLMQNPKQLVYAGKTYLLSEKHRVILTGNPDSYDGRSMDLAIKDAMLTMHYHEMTEDALTELIIYPALPTNWNSTAKQQAVSAILHLYTVYQSEFSLNLGPRDLQDALARMQTALTYSTESKQPITSAQINHLVWQSFKEAIAGSIDIKQQHKLTTLENDYTKNFPQDSSILTARTTQFLAFLNKLKQQNPELQLTAQPIADLVHNYWLFLNNQNSELIARHGMFVEGPAGWGKDVILDAVLTLWEQDNPPVSGNKFIHINANPDNWDKIVEFILWAMANGVKVIISEINLLPSRYLEGLFNDILTQPAVAGFMLFATVNPSSFANREVLSDAFMSRVTQIKLNNLTQEQLKNILSSKFADTKLVAWLLDNYQILDTKLKQQKSPIVLTLDDLLTLATDMQNSNENQWPLLFKKNFGLAMKSINIKLSDLAINTTAVVSQSDIKKVQSASTNKDISYISNKSSIKQFKADNITDSSSFTAIKYFANDTNTTKYRLQLNKVVVNQGNISRQRLFTTDTDVEQITPPLLPQQTTLKLQQGELLGSSKFLLLKDQWVMLPGISPDDECCGINSEKPILLARSKNTGQLMVKLKDSIEDRQIVKIDFIIKPSLIDINSANVAEQLHPVIQDEYLKQLLDTQIFSPDALRYESCKQLQQIKAIADPKLKMQKLISWAQNFKYDKNATSTGNNAFIEVIQQQIGSCRHRSAAFQVLAEYFGIPANIVSNDSHAFVEFSLDNEKSWITADLGGAPTNLTEIEPDNIPEFSNYTDDSDDFIDSEGHIKPNKFIDFLLEKFPFYGYKIQLEYVSENMDMYFIKNENDILTKLFDIFNDWIKIAYNRQSGVGEVLAIAKRYITKCILYLQKVYTMQSSLPESEGIRKLTEITLGNCLPLIKNLGIVAPLLPVLDLLKLNDNYSKEATAILNNFYQYLAENQQKQIEYIQKNKATYNLIDATYLELSGNSKTLLNALQRVSLKKHWSYTSTGESPNLTRLASKKPAFPFNEDAKNSQVATFISASNGYKLKNNLAKNFKRFIYNTDNNSKIKQSFANYDPSINRKELSAKATIVAAIPD